MVKNAGSCLNRGHRMCRRPYRVWHRAPPGVFCMHREYHRVWWENLWHTKKWRDGNTTVTHRVIFVLPSDSSYRRRVGFVFISCLNRHHRGHFSHGDQFPSPDESSMGPRISPKTTRRRTLFVLPLKTHQNCAIIRRITARWNRDDNTIFAKTCTWRKFYYF